MKSGHRLAAIIVIWGAFAIASFFTLIALAAAHSWNSGSASVSAIFIALFYVVGALGATQMVMRARGTGEEDSALERGNQKPKRSDMGLAERLIDSMSDEELDALRRRLMGGSVTIGDDGELIPAERSTQRRR